MSPPAEGHAALTIRDVLRLPSVTSGWPEVLAGADELGREVRWVHVLDLPDVDGMLSGGELVLTTGQGMGSTAVSRTAFIDAVSQAGAVGLMIELGSVFEDQLPEDVIEAARRVKLPLVAFRRTVRFVDITEAVHTELVDRRALVYRRAEQIGSSILQLVLEDSGVHAVLQRLAEHLESPVIVTDQFGRVLDHVDFEGQEALAVWAQAGSHPAKRPAWESTELRSARRVWGRLVALGRNALGDEFGRLVLGHAARAIELTVRAPSVDQDMKARSRSLFLDELAAGALSDRQAKLRAGSLGIASLPDQASVLVARWRDQPPTVLERGLTHVANRLSLGRVIVGPLGACTSEVLLAERETESWLVVGAAPAPYELARRIWQELTPTGLSYRDVIVAIGTPSADTWAGIGGCLRATSLAARAALVREPRAWFDAAQISIADYLLTSAGDADLIAMVDRQLAPLLRADDTSRELLDTLRVYLECGGNKVRVAERLHVQRQTLYRRLRRIEILLRSDLTDPEVVLSLQFAVKAHAYRSRSTVD